jgi:hypothetical protein
MKISLLAQDATGGAIARDGFGYQDAYVLQHLPTWLTQGAFSHVVSEAAGDIEVCYFAPSGSIVRAFYEAKGKQLTEGDFWAEVEQFKKAYDTSPSEFVHFVLICRGYNSVTSPLVAKVERLRGVGASYDLDGVMHQQTRQEIVDWVVGKGKPAELGQFIVDRVDFESYADEHAHSAFNGEVDKHFPTLNLRTKDVAALRDRFVELVSRSSRQHVTRRELEQVLVALLGNEAQTWLKLPTPVYDDDAGFEVLRLPMQAHNGPDRGQLQAANWRSFMDRANGVSGFLKSTCQRATVALSSKQRMSTACALGYCFSATRGFILDMEHNGLGFRTDDHSKAPEQFFDVSQSAGSPGMTEGMAFIEFSPTLTLAKAASAVAKLAPDSPRLALTTSKAIDSQAILNRAVADAKAVLVEFRAVHSLTKVHLFIKGPSHFAMYLGHRLNGVAIIQLYDWVDGAYCPTALLA